ncbi:uncharacterized protein LOC143292249 [Babylonia areolata]|uniref:uncharacterized protein LOC143292249 n=1 Tax=Babylonia areolata TaxID=304850 RepID=UPI003FD0ED05
MSFNASKCHVLSVTRKKTPFPTTYCLYNEELQKVKKAKYLGVELTKDLHWGAHIQATTTKADKTSAFMYRNLRGCPYTTQTTCYKGLVRPILEYAAPVWDPPQQYLTTNLEIVQRRSARRIMHDSRPTTSATELVTRLELEPLKLRRTADKATTIYKIMGGLVEVAPRDGTLVRTNRTGLPATG